jgi:hypothetical protein
MSSARLDRVHAAASVPESEERPEISAPKTYDCDLCGESFEGVPGGSGLFLWTRGEELRVEEPPLCEECASRVTIGALMKWEIEEEEEG